MEKNDYLRNFRAKTDSIKKAREELEDAEKELKNDMEMDYKRLITENMDFQTIVIKLQREVIRLQKKLKSQRTSYYNGKPIVHDPNVEIFGHN